MSESARLRLILNGTLFVGLHFLAIAGVVVYGARPFWLVYAAFAYAVMVFGITAGHHRYFSHRAFKTSRAFQLVIALCGAMAGQRGALWWAGHHRHHHRHTDAEGDVHSPVEGGFFWSHVGWILSGEHAVTPIENVKDLAQYPELVWLNRNHVVPPIAFVVISGLIGGPGLASWSLFSMMAVYHVIFSTNSITHLWGTRRFETADNSRNNPVVALLTFGEGWHNNHHHYPPSAKVGFYWWEIDISYSILKCLEKLGLVWDINVPPQSVLDRGLAH